MTLEEMIQTVRTMVGLDGGEQIIAALRAGRAMRYELRPLHGFDKSEGAKAWDDALGEEP